MALIDRIKTVLAKIETTYGTDAIPTGAANAMLVANVALSPLEGGTVERPNVQPYMGGFAQLQVNSHVALEFDVEVAGVSSPGTAAPYGPLLRACGLSETLAVTGETTSITVTNGGSGFTSVPTVNITLGGGTGATATAIVIGGVVAAVYMTARGSGYTTAPTVGFTGGGGTGATATAGIGSAKYKPISSAFEAVTIHFHQHGQKHAMVGARGDMSVRLNTAGVPYYHFRFLGLLVAPASVTDPTVTLTSFQTPQPTSNKNSPIITLHGQTLAVRSFQLNLANQVEYRNLAGGAGDSVQIVDRKTAGNISFEAPAISVKDWFTTAQNGTIGTFRVQQGIGTGKTVDISGLALNTAQVLSPRYSPDQGIVMVEADLSFVPTTVGNDEFEIMVA